MKYIYILLLVLVSIFAVACSRREAVEVINTDASGLAVRGYDAVAFFAEEAAVRGNPTFEFTWNGAKWLFASAENLNKFKTDPAAFAPQFGGYCSYAVSHGYTADGDPQMWKIFDGKLYLNYNKEAKEAWEKNQDNYIKDGEKNWKDFQNKKPQHKG